MSWEQLSRTKVYIAYLDDGTARVRWHFDPIVLNIVRSLPAEHRAFRKEQRAWIVHPDSVGDLLAALAEQGYECAHENQNDPKPRREPVSKPTKAGLPRTRALKVENLKAHHIFKEFVGMGHLLEFGCDGLSWWIRTTAFKRLDFTGGDYPLRYYLEQDDA